MLSVLQERVARLVASLPEADGFALAGGAALVVGGVVDRTTRDLDFFGPSADDVEQLAAAVERALSLVGLQVRRERQGRGFVRFVVIDDAASTELDLAADARIRPVEPGPFGPMLALEELAADKLLALFDRAQARDFVDVAALINRFGLERMCQLAGEKDRGFSRVVLAEMLGSFGRFSADELDVDEPTRQELVRSVESWRGQLTEQSTRPAPRRDRGPDLSL